MTFQPWPEVSHGAPGEASRALATTGTACSNHLASYPQWRTWCWNPAGKMPRLLSGGAQCGCILPTFCQPCTGPSGWWIGMTIYACQTHTQSRSQNSLQQDWGLEVRIRANQPLKSHSQCVWFGRSADGASLTHTLLEFVINVSTWIKCCNR